MNRSDLTTEVNRILGYEIHDEEMGLPYVEIGLDSFALSELLVRLEHLLEPGAAAALEEAVFNCASLDEALRSLQDVGAMAADDL